MTRRSRLGKKEEGRMPQADGIANTEALRWTGLPVGEQREGHWVEQTEKGKEFYRMERQEGTR